PARIRLAEFTLGYLLVWAAIGVPAFGVAVAVQAMSMSAPGALRWVVVGVLLAVAVYQITPLKQLCLKHCRSPLSQLQYATYQGRLRTCVSEHITASIAPAAAGRCSCCWSRL